MSELKPLVSILMTAFNRELYIADAIESVLNSSYENIELIILDDCSTDKTVAIANQYLSDRRVQLHVNKQNLGQFPNRNKIADYAKGEFIMYVDSDDMVLKDGIENLVAAMQQFPRANFAMSSPNSGQLRIVESADAIREHFFKQTFLTHGPGGTFMNRAFFISIGKYPIDYGIPGDMYFNLKAATHSPVLLIPFSFMFYRMHEGQEINNKYDYLYNNYKYMRDALHFIPMPLNGSQKKWIGQKNKRRFAINVIKFFFKTRDLKRTAEAIRKAEFGLRDAITGIFHFG